MRKLLFLDDTDRFEQRGKPRLVIRAEDRCAVAGNPAVFPEGGLNILSGNHGIHMAGEQQLRRCCHAFGRPGNEQIARPVSGTLL
ncbi:hypothetical protein D3C75_1154540 [compost metagenome]